MDACDVPTSGSPGRIRAAAFSFLGSNAEARQRRQGWRRRRNYPLQGQPVVSIDDLHRLLTESDIGKRDLEIIRGFERMDLTIVPGEADRV